MTIRWITSLLGTAAFDAVQNLSDIEVVDVRDLVDKAGNDSSEVLNKIRQGIDLVAQGRRTVICCDYGMSRSNSIAVGILSSLEKLSFEAALRKVQEATGETEIKLEPLSAVRQALGLTSKKEKHRKYRSILVTGGQGFIGSELLKSLGNSELKIIAPTREQIDISIGSTQLDLLASEEDIDCIVHLANPRIYTSNVAMGQSLTMLRNVIDVCIDRDIPLIYPSSWEIYSGYSGQIYASEYTPALPRGSYGEAKYLSEILIEHYRCTRGLNCALLRSGLIYGLQISKPKFIFNFSHKAKQGNKIITHCYRNGFPRLDLIHINDFISLLIATIKLSFIGTLNIGSGHLISTLYIAEVINDYFGNLSSIEQININMDFASILMDYRRASFELNWQPTITIEQGLRSLLPQIC